MSFGTTLSAEQEPFGADQQTFHSLYFERGLSPKLTLGLDGGMNHLHEISAFVFVKRPIPLSLGDHRLAWRVGAGIATLGGQQETLAMAGLYWGLGFETGLGPGWAMLDLQTHLLTETNETLQKAEFTLGIKPNEKLKVMLQAQAGNYPGSDPYLRLAPSIAYAISEGRHIEVGLQYGVVGDTRVGVKVGTWIEF